MNSTFKTLLISLLIILLSGGCVSRKKLTYLQDARKPEAYDVYMTELKPSVTPSIYKIMPYDNLYIRVITPDPQWSVIFNVMPTGSSGTLSEEGAALFGYVVDIEGKVEIPYVGKVEVGGKTLSEIRADLDLIFKNYVSDAAITVRLVNNFISILGEVRAPGRYRLAKDRLNVFEALSMAGDLNEFSNRQKVHLIRPSPYGPVIKELSLTGRGILASEFYYLMPNDVIYAMPLPGRSFRINSPIWTLFLTTITSALGVIAFFRTL